MGKQAHARKPAAARKPATTIPPWTPYALLIAVASISVAWLLPYLTSPGGAPQRPTQPRSNVGTSGGGHAAAAAAAAAVCNAAADEHIMCEAWHKAGHCRSRAADMRSHCPRTCGWCEGIAGRNPPAAREDRCRRDNHTAAVPARQLHAQFERILREYPEYEPTALSTSPYVLLLKNFLNSEEAEAFQSVCKSSFERSLAGDQLNPVRTSFQCWCNFAGCFTNPHVHNVTRRINSLLRIPYNNGEDLQIVRYLPGQFYRRHHDQNTALWAPQGPRVLTFFMYLNDPDEGGETAFPSVGPPPGLKVSPKLGHAVLWPSTLDERPMDADGRTDHEAMDVIKGVKYGANMWVHQFDFKTPSERGCELTYVNTAGRRPQTREHAALVGGGRVPTAEETEQLAAEQGSI